MGNSVLLSICIPTNGIVEWVLPVIDSIYSQGVDNNEFEVIITDNGEKDDLESQVSCLSYSNFHYYRTTSKGFENQVDAFEKCSGLFCKMLNHRSKMVPGSIKAILQLIKKVQNQKPILYFAEGVVPGDELIECANIDEFVRVMNYHVSWSAGTGAWRDDLQNIRNKKIDKMFPHTVYLFGLRKESKYVIWNKEYEQMSDDAGKGGYDLFDTFAVHFLELIKELKIEGRICNKTYRLVKWKHFKFLTKLYKDEVIMPTKHNFIIQNIRKSIGVFYGITGYGFMVIFAYALVVKELLVRNMKRNR